MGGQHHDVHDLAGLAELSGEALRVACRRGLANLASLCAARALPLEGLDSERVRASMHVALEEGLLDDLSWLSGPSAAMVLYELASALPPGDEQTRLNTMVSERLAVADAATFTAIATALAHNSRAGFTSARMRSRVALVLALPMGTGGQVDSLALALIMQPDYAREWVEKPSQGSLPSRRLAARLLERAAREAARLWAQRDDAGVRALESSAVKTAWDRLLRDRESLVWRHVAVARGLIAHAIPALQEEITRSLDPSLTPTEWRRGAASVAASIAVVPRQALAQAETFLSSDVVQRDPGLPASMMLGLLRAAEAEPEAAGRLLGPLLRAGAVSAAEALLELLQEAGGDTFGREAVTFAAAVLREQVATRETQADDGAIALIEWIYRRFANAPEVQGSVDQLVRRALLAFVQQGSSAAVEIAARALEQARAKVDALATADVESREGRMAMLHALQELDVGLLQASTLADLLALGEDQELARGALHELFEQLTAVLLGYEQHAVDQAQLAHPTLRMRRIRALLHVVDADGSYGDDWAPARRPRRLRATRVLLQRARQEASSPLRRAVLACLARSFDALVREDVFELSDVILCLSLYTAEPADIATLAEASMMPELSAALDQLGPLLDKTLRASDTVSVRRDSIAALGQLVRALPAACSPRVSVLRSSLLRVQLGLSALHGVRSLADIVDPSGNGNTLDELGEALQTIAQLMAGSRRRLAPNASVRVPTVAAAVYELGAAFEQVVASREPQHITEPLAALDACLAAELSPPFHSAVIRVVSALKVLPLSAQKAPSSTGVLKRVTSPGVEERGLPPWLPPNRLLGGFYVLHALGEGGVGSVFVARRAEERDDESAEVFALKVPEYNGDVSHVLSEADFLKMFREEAGALLALPNDEHIARFVTFDAGVKPKPILVMEHVEGPSLEKLLTRRHIDVAQAFDILDGIAKGLAAMHATGLAHLDVKPSNVILRDYWNGALSPVLVDFGLSGRRLRPGCGTANYAAPEIWGAAPFEAGDDPRPADVYALGCVAYELLTGNTLFDADSLQAIVAAHGGHDGMPEPVRALHRDLKLRPLGEFLTSCLRKHPKDRLRLSDLTWQILALRASLESQPWPLLPALDTIARPARSG